MAECVINTLLFFLYMKLKLCSVDNSGSWLIIHVFVSIMFFSIDIG